MYLKNYPNNVTQNLFFLGLPANLNEKQDTSDENINASLNSENLAKIENIYDNMQANDELNKFTDELKSKLLKFIESTELICGHFQKQNDKSNGEDDYVDLSAQQFQKNPIKSLTLFDYLCSIDGVCVSLNGEHSSKNALYESTQISIEKYDSLKNLNAKLDLFKKKFEATSVLKSDDSKHELFFSMTNLLSQSIKLNDSEDLISSFYYKPNQSMSPLNKQVSFSGPNMGSLNTNQNDSSSDIFQNSIERFIYKSGSQIHAGSDNLSSSTSSLNGKFGASNYLLSFYEYCKTLYEYFKEKSMQASTMSSSSFFSILNSSPASLICKLLFEEGIKPQLIESLTQKLNLNLTAIILHNSCPHLKLTLSSKRRMLAGIENETTILLTKFKNEN